MKILKNILPLFLLGMLTYVACTSDKTKTEEEDKTAELIQGHWELSTAYRNDKLTETLSGIYFDFKDGDKMLTNFNLSGEEKQASFKLKNKKILAEVGGTYHIQSIDEKKLVLTTKMRGYKFKLKLEKK